MPLKSEAIKIYTKCAWNLERKGRSQNVNLEKKIIDRNLLKKEKNNLVFDLRSQIIIFIKRIELVAPVTFYNLA